MNVGYESFGIKLVRWIKIGFVLLTVFGILYIVFLR